MGGASQASDRGRLHEGGQQGYLRGDEGLLRARRVPDLAKEHHIGMEFNSFDKFLETFFARKWAALRASGSSGGFITCDHPLCLYWSDPEMARRLPSTRAR